MDQCLVNRETNLRLSQQDQSVCGQLRCTSNGSGRLEVGSWIPVNSLNILYVLLHSIVLAITYSELGAPRTAGYTVSL